MFKLNNNISASSRLHYFHRIAYKNEKLYLENIKLEYEKMEKIFPLYVGPTMSFRVISHLGLNVYTFRNEFQHTAPGNLFRACQPTSNIGHW